MGSGGSPGPWTPADLSPVEWWDFSDSGTITTASGAIANINSKGSGGRSASNATANQRPTVSTLNGVQAALFDGINDNLALSSNLNTAAQMTVAQVFGRASAGILSQPIGGSSAGNPPFATQWWTDNVRYSALWGLGFAIHGSASTATGAFQHTLIKGASTTSLYEHGAIVGTPQTNGTGTGSVTYIGRRAAHYHAGLLCEIIVVNSALSDSDRQKLEGYLAHKWGMAGDLPVGHPYKSAPPP
jgi:hypothetical protein